MRRPIVSSDQNGEQSFSTPTGHTEDPQPDDRLARDQNSTGRYTHTMESALSQPSIVNNDVRSRSTSMSYNTARQPINQAVSSAFNTTTTESSISPDLIDQITQQITQNVIQQLSVHPVHIPTAQQPVLSSAVDQSESRQTDQAPVYTTPSSHKLNSEPAAVYAPKGLPTFFHDGSTAGPVAEETRETSPLSHGSDTPRPGNESEKDDQPRRPNMSRRITTDSDATVLEKCWGKFFDKDGRCMPRLSQFLRGIALHIIEDYEPKNSLIITPTKMQQYYDETRIQSSDERYPWKDIFDDNTSKISRLFREFGVEHHLMQRPGKVHERPDMPGLTPNGFATWMTLLIRAHPDEEFERLSTTVREMPINNPDDKTERYPKSLSRRLLPLRGDSSVHERLCGSINEYCNLAVAVNPTCVLDEDSNYQPPTVTDESEEVTRSSSPVTSPATHASAERLPASSAATYPQPPTSTTRLDERRRHVFSKTPSVTSTEEDTTDVPTPQPVRRAQQNPLERDRQPYVSSSTGGRLSDAASTESGDRPGTSSNPVVERESGRARRRKSVSERVDRQERSRPYVHQHDVSRSRNSAAESASMYRTRSNSSYEPDVPVSSRRARTNSVYDNSEKYYRRNRSPSQSHDLPRRPEGYTLNYTTSSPTHGYFPPPVDRHEQRNQPDYVSRPERYERSRDSISDTRPRYLDEYYRDGATSNVVYSNKDTYAQYPPSAYRDAW